MTNKTSKNIYEKDYVVIFDYGTTSAVYLFPHRTKKQIVQYCVEQELVGEMCNSITFEEANKRSDGEVIIITAYKNFLEEEE